MSRVIKNNDGVAIVEGTPAASLVKDVDKFFAAKPPERMAGESIAPVRRDRMLTGKFKDKDGNEIIGRKPTREEFDSYLAEQGIFKIGEEPLPPRPINTSNEVKKAEKSVEDKRRFTGGSKDFNERTGRVEPGFRDSPKRKPNMPSNRSEARDKAESRRRRFFERRRSAKEAKRSEREQKATQGKFITTLGR